jgi:hypothetical protein
MVEINLLVERHQFVESMQSIQPAGKGDAWPMKGIQKDPLASKSGPKTVNLLKQRVCALDGWGRDSHVKQDSRCVFR